MNSNAIRWVEALRSGDYAQTTGRLRRPSRVFWRRDTYCVMGVLYDLYLRSSGSAWPRKLPTGPLPEHVLTWAGISAELERALVAHNDEGYNFRDLASIIEAHMIRAARQRVSPEVEQTVNAAIRKAQAAARQNAARVAH
jgi:hypothetical protein